MHAKQPKKERRPISGAAVRASRGTKSAVRKAEPLFTKIFKASPHPIGITELATGRCIEINDACLKTYGFRRNEVIGKTTLMLGIWPDPGGRAAFIKRLTSEGAVRNLEVAMRMKSGELRHFLISADLITFKRKRCLLTIGNDVTERKRVEDELRHAHEDLASQVQERTAQLAQANAVLEKENSERQHAQQLLNANEVFARHVLDSLPAHVCVLNKAGVILRTNDAWKRFAQENSEPGAHVGEVGDNYLEVCRRAIAGGDTTVRVMLDGIESILAGQQAMFSVEYPCHAPHESRWFLLRATSLKDGGGGAVLSHLNVTERKAAEEKLRLFIEYAPAAIAMFARDMRYMAASRRWRDDYGLTENIIGRSHYEVFPEMPDHWKEVHRRGLAGETLRAEEERFMRANGVSQWVKWEVLPWYSGTEVGGVLIATEDVTERVGAREALRQSEERFRGIFEHAAEGIAIMDFKGRFQQCNPAFCAIVGYSAEELSTMRFSALIHPEDLSHNMALIRQLMSGSIPFFELTNRYVTKSGESEWVSKHVSILRDDKGEPTYLVAIVTDVTVRRQAEEAMQRYQTDLRAYQEQLQDLTAKLLGSQESERQRIARELHDDVSQRLAALVLDVSSLEQQPPPGPDSTVRALEPIRTHLEQLADDVHNLAYRLHPSLLNHAGLRPAIEDHLGEVTRRTGIPVVFTARQVPDAMPQDHAMCLFRVMQESVQNIVKHACATDVVVRLSGSSKGVGLSVMDDGRGFNLGDEIAQQKGLGLASMQERMRLANGFLRIHSRPGRGTKVCAWIPRVQEHA